MKNLRNITLAACAAAVITSIVVPPSLATPGQGAMPAPIVNGHFGTLNENTSGDKTGKWGLHLKTLDDTDIGVDRITLQASGFTGWHAHPSPVFVTVTQGSITWVDGSDPLCTERTFNTGESFIEGAYKVHDVRNASASAAAEYVAVVIKPVGFVGPAFRLDRAEPNNCNF